MPVPFVAVPAAFAVAGAIIGGKAPGCAHFVPIDGPEEDTLGLEAEGETPGERQALDGPRDEPDSVL